MKNTPRYILSVCLASVSIFLVGCGSSEPSESEMFDAMITYDQNQTYFGNPEKFKKDAKKLGCEKVGDKSFKCLIGKRDGSGSGSLPARFMKTDDAWVMTAFGAQAN